MKILLVNTYDKGGAAKACLRLHEALILKGYDSNLLILHPSQDNSRADVKVFQPKSSNVFTKILNRVIRKFDFKRKQRKAEEYNFRRNRSKHLEYFSMPDSNYDITQSEYYKNADVINLHWVAQFLDYESFFRKNKKPVFWTMHDMSPFLGGEHYEEIYDGIDDSGNPIPRIIKPAEKIMFDSIIAKKRMIFRSVNNLKLISPSNWLKTQAQNSELFGNYEGYCIPNTIDSDTFRIYEDLDFQNSNKIDKTKTNILFVSQSLKNSRKGIEILIKTIVSLNDDRLSFYAVGSDDNIDLETLGITSFGSIDSEDEMCQIYNAMDVFVLPSLIDNLPNTAIESCMCGTPVIGFDVGGISDIIDDGLNGILVAQANSSGLRDGIEKFLDLGVKWNRNEIRKHALEKYNAETVVNQYINVFEMAMKN